MRNRISDNVAFVQKYKNGNPKKAYAEDADTNIFYCRTLALSYPFMPMTDLTFAAEVLYRWLKHIIWKTKKMITQNKVVLILSLSFLLYSPPHFTQTTEISPFITLNEIWSIAESNNRELKLSDLEVQKSNLQILEAKDRLLPQISLGSALKLNSRFLIFEDGLLSSPQEVPIKDYGYNIGYTFNYNIYNGGQEKRNIMIKKEEHLQKNLEAQIQKSRIKYNTSTAFYDLYKFLNFLDFLAAEIETEKKQLALIENLHRNGTVLKSDVLRISVKLSELQLNYSSVEKKIIITKQKLNVLMNRHLQEEIRINYKELESFNTKNMNDFRDYMEMALNQSPDLKMTTSNISLSELSIKQSKAAVLPKIVLFSNYNYTYPQNSFYPYTNRLWGFGQTGIQIQYSLDNLYKSKNLINQAKINASEAKERADIKKDELYLQLKEAYLQKLQAMESVDTAIQNITKTSETVRVIKSSYLNQESLLTDLLTAENALLEAKFNLTTAQANVKMAEVKLSAIIGTL